MYVSKNNPALVGAFIINTYVFDGLIFRLTVVNRPRATKGRELRWYSYFST